MKIVQFDYHRALKDIAHANPQKRSIIINEIIENNKEFLTTKRKFAAEEMHFLEEYYWLKTKCDFFEECHLDDWDLDDNLRDLTKSVTLEEIEIELYLNDFAERIFSVIMRNNDEYSENFDALNRLEVERNAASGYYVVEGIRIDLPGLMSAPIRPLSQFYNQNLEDPEYKVRMDRLISILKMLLDYFGNDGIKVTLRVKTGENEDIVDFFVKMPDGRQFALILRSNGSSFVKWREDKQSFYVYRKGRKGMNKWDSMDSAIEKLKSTIKLKHQQSPLLGTTRAERNRPINKVIVLCGNTKLANTNEPEFWTDFGRTKALKIYKDSLTYVVEQDSLIDFLLPPLPAK